MNDPIIYVVVNENERADAECWDIGSNLDWCQGRAKQMAQSRQGTAIVYKLVPVFEARLEVITNVITRDLKENEKP